MEAELKEAIYGALKELGVGEVSFAVEVPNDLAHGDYATNAAMAAAKSLGKNPREVAELLIPLLKNSLGGNVADIQIAGPGFINISLSESYVRTFLKGATAKDWGLGFVNSGSRVLVEYSCPNPFKEMHVGHLMSTIIGESVSRLISASGATVIRDSYGGDVGPHVAKALWELKRKGVTEVGSAKELGDAYAHGSRAYEESENAKAEIDALNTELYAAIAKEEIDLTQEERDLLTMWRRGREVALESFRDIYHVLDTTFDYLLFESDTTPIGMRVVTDELERGVFERSEGAVIYNGEKKGLHTLVFITSRGTPTYEAKDVGLAFLKEEQIPNDEVFILTGAEQIGHFKVFLAALEDIAPLVAKKTHHIPHGLLQLPGGKMSSRKGNVLTAEEVISEIIAKALERNEDPIVAEQVALGALKYLILRASPGSNIIFDIEKSLSLEGDSGPYLQYALVRAKSILASAEEKIGDAEAPSDLYPVERVMAHFPEVVAYASREHAPNHVVQYLTELAGEWNSFYAKERIIGGEFEAYKLQLAQTFVHTMQQGLKLLAIPTPEKM